MIKLLLLILVGLALAFFSYKTFLSDNSSLNLPGYNSTSPTDAIQGARGAVEQSQNLQNQINQKAQEQLNQ